MLTEPPQPPNPRKPQPPKGEAVWELGATLTSAPAVRSSPPWPINNAKKRGSAAPPQCAARERSSLGERCRMRSVYYPSAVPTANCPQTLCSRQESNLHRLLRREASYPLNDRSEA